MSYGSSYDLSDLQDWLDDYGSDYFSGGYSDYDYGYGSSSYGSSDSSGYLPSDFSGNGAVSDTCVKSVAFKTTGSRVDLAFDVLFFLVYLGLLAVIALHFFKSSQKLAALAKWFLFVVTLFLALLYLIIDIITLSLYQCMMLSTARNNLILAGIRWIDGLSAFSLVVLILIPICLKLQSGGLLHTITLAVHAGWLGVTGVLLIASLGLNTRYQHGVYTEDTSLDYFDLAKSMRDVSMAFFVFLFLATLLGAVSLSLSLFYKKNIRQGTLFIAILVLIVSSLAYSLVLMGSFADLYYESTFTSASSLADREDAAMFLSRFFYTIVFLSALVIAGSNQTIHEDTERALEPPAPQPDDASGGASEPKHVDYESNSVPAP